MSHFSLLLNSTDDGFQPAKTPKTHIVSPIDAIENTNGAGITLFVIGGLVVFACIFLYFISFCIYHPNRQDTEAPPPFATMSKNQRTGLRYAEVESWLISRKIESHDEICDKVLLYVDSCTKMHRTSSVDTVCTDEEVGSSSSEAGEEKECPVCMEALKVGDLVSWSPNPKCGHAFHHTCIKEWLLKKKCCPYCRETFLPVDQLEGLSQAKQIEELLLGQQQRAAKSFFCIRHGVMTLSKPELCFSKKCELEQILNKVHRVPSRTELADIRGSHIENVDSSCEPEGCIPVNMEMSGDTDSPATSSILTDEELAEPPTSESTDDFLAASRHRANESTDEEHAP
jgi:hypothetical protein